MAVLKCKMCGGTLTINDDSGIATCEYCGTKQTISKTTDDVISNLYNRANNLRLKNEFDKALSIYEKIVEQDDSESEAHWGLVLCKYGIEYVDDPNTGKKVPTCHRTSFDSIKNDIDYQAAIDYSSTEQQTLYEEEAREIDRLQKEILSIAKNEKPFDVFICYKETDESGKRTVDSVLANDIYYQLTQDGYKVFYAAITLEDKLGQEYEPYIFSALNSAKVMLVIGTKPEYFNAVWVKNEWSRFLSLMKKDRTKTLIPCYRDLDAYNLPEEFAHLQAQDMSKIGFINDIIRGIKKIINTDKQQLKSTNSITSENKTVENQASSLLKRAFIFLEDKNWEEADEYCERVLDQDPENAQAYLGKLLASKHISKVEDLINLDTPFDDDYNYQKVLRYGDNKTKELLENYIKEINIRNENKRIESIYETALNQMSVSTTSDGYNLAAESFKKILDYKDSKKLYDECIEKAIDDDYEFALYQMKNANSESYYLYAADLFNKILDYKDSKELKEKCLEKAEIAKEERKESIYQNALSKINNLTSLETQPYVEAISLLNDIKDYKDSNKKIEYCENKIKETEQKIEEDKALQEKRIAETKKKKKIITEIVITTILVSLALASFYIKVIVPYDNALKLIDSGDYEKAYELLNDLNYKDSNNLLISVRKALLAKEKVGSYVLFGSYEQDNNTSNGKEPIEWLVLAKADDKMLVISKYGLDYQPFNTTKTSVTWETCSLRKWLNDDFLNAAFNSEEQSKMINVVTVVADKNPSYSTNQGNDTKDKIFLLSTAEVLKYYISDLQFCVSTDYVKAQINRRKDPQYEGWTLRTMGEDFYLVSDFRGDGLRYDSGHWVNIEGCVRPALWINLES